MIAPVSVKEPWRVWENMSGESTNKWFSNHNKTKHNKIMYTVNGI